MIIHRKPIIAITILLATTLQSCGFFSGMLFPAKRAPASADIGEMVLVPAGNFQMGCDPTHNSAYSPEFCGALLLHTIFLDAYRIDKFEVTNEQYGECVMSGSCKAATDYNYNADYLTNPKYADFPVVDVNWYQASAYCSWAGKRLPSESEWEKAARGSGDTREYPWGDQTPDCTLTNFKESCVGHPSTVGSFPQGASPYGAMDMIGNVWEWVNDWYDLNYYTISPAKNPTGPPGRFLFFNTDIIFKVLRGGGWKNNNFEYQIGVARRYDFHPEISYDEIGFRCADSTGK